MKKAVIQTGGKQYIVEVGQELKVELLNSDSKTVTFEPLLLLDDDKVQIGSPTLANTKVVADVIEANVQSDKVTSIRYKAKKRVRTVRGHRQRKAILKIKSIA
jgi:large subunit ribosomal protein L21